MQSVPSDTTSATSPGTVDTRETDRLISSDKVDGTAVYNRQGEKLGSTYTLMIDKRSGQVEYAVMSFGGFLGMGTKYHPLPWQALDYDTQHGGYVVDVDTERLKSAPTYEGNDAERWRDPAFGRGVDDYYGVRRP